MLGLLVAAAMRAEEVEERERRAYVACKEEARASEEAQEYVKRYNAVPVSGVTNIGNSQRKVSIKIEKSKPGAALAPGERKSNAARRHTHCTPYTRVLNSHG